MAFYPYVSTLRIQGGEVFAMRGFRELVDDVTLLVRRPVLSISTNGTLIDGEWAERLVRTPFSNVTVSIDGGTRATYNRLRKGADLDQVLCNIDRVRRWKTKLQSEVPYLDSFFVVMRSNFREIPQYLELMHRHGMTDVAFQTMELSPENSARVPTLEADEAIADRAEVEELNAILQESLRRFRTSFRMIRLTVCELCSRRTDLARRFWRKARRTSIRIATTFPPAHSTFAPIRGRLFSWLRTVMRTFASSLSRSAISTPIRFPLCGIRPARLPSVAI
jgi:MoaA/NifB/PqqE/SkfB family radical SAM enzyme